MGNDILSVAVPLLATTILAVGIVVVAKPEPVMQILTGKNALERACSEPQNAKVISQIGTCAQYWTVARCCRFLVTIAGGGRLHLMLACISIQKKIFFLCRLYSKNTLCNAVDVCLQRKCWWRMRRSDNLLTQASTTQRRISGRSRQARQRRRF
jgi:hypothetical protein